MCSSEVEVVKKIANQIFDVWRPKLEAFNKNLVGMTSRLLQMNMHLALGLDDVRFVAIVGMGGIGKTTIAQVVFDCLLSKFDDSCFLTLPRGDSKQSLVPLQREMLSKIFREDFIIWNDIDGVEMIKNRLSSRKVLLVLDGVEEKMQLEKLVGSIDWLGPGSRVIVTTRNKELLYQPNNVEVKEYNVEELDHDSALQLFLKHAFGINHPKNNFMDPSTKIVEKVKRLPLALRVIGSFLYRKEIAIWRETLNRLMKVDEKSFFDVLKISYDGLGRESKQVFLDLTCLLNGKSEDKVIEILESFGYSPKTEIQLLKDRCLIEISNKKISIHDLILEMGREIVHKESLTQPGKQSRIWLQEDLYCKFVEKHELMYIEGIVLSLEEEAKESIQLDVKSFAEMRKLKILEINNVELSEDIEYLSQVLRLINWPGYPSKRLPPTFQSRYLFQQLMPHSCILRLWEGKKKFEKLKVIDASNSEHLCMTPNFSGVPNLEKLVLRDCVKLREVHPSINSLNNLILLDLNGCSNLKLFPPNIRCQNLQTLALMSTGLECSPKIGGNMERLTQLHLAGSNITQIHPSIECLTGLTLLNLSRCARLLSLPTEIGNLSALKILILQYCTKLDQIPPSLGNAESLEKLDISGTPISHVPSSMHHLKNLIRFDCKGLSRGIWKSLVPQFKSELVSGGLGYLNTVHLSCCGLVDEDVPEDLPCFSFLDGLTCGIWKSLVPQFKSNPISSGLGCLKTLNLSCCRLVDEDVPEDLHCFSSLEGLNLSYNDFIKLPDSLSHLKKLRRLYLNYCQKLKDLPKLPTSLEKVEGEGCISISEKFYNKRLHILSDLKENLLFDFSIPSKTTKVECSVNELQHTMLDRKLCEVSISGEKRCTDIYSNVDTLECFDHINEGSWINIEYNQESSFNKDISNVCGVLFSANIEFQQTLGHFEDILGNLSVKFDIDGNPPNFYMRFEEKFQSQRSIWVAYLPIKFLKDEFMVQSCCSVKITISYDNIHAKVKACGASIFSWQNASDYLANFFTMVYCSKRIFHRIIKEVNHEGECRCDELEFANDDFPSSAFESTGTDSTFLQRKNLRSILGRMFEEDKGFQVSYFPQTKVSRWFRNQNKKDKVAIKLPLNIRKDKKWMGLAAFGIFSISHNANCYCFSYDEQLDDRCLSCKDHIPIKLLQYSNRILILVFKPREWYEQNSSSNHVYISFNTNVERMQIESCGARLVYK